MGRAPAANTSKPSARILATSRTGPSQIAPTAPCPWAAAENSSPQYAVRASFPVAITATAPRSSPSMNRIASP